MSLPPAVVATHAVRAARVVVACGAVVRRWSVATGGRSIYLRCAIAGRRFTVRVSDHRSRDVSSTCPYYFVRIDRPHLAGISGLPRFLASVAHGDGSRAARPPAFP